MVGNVWEWCADWFAPDYYARVARRRPPGAGRPASSRVMRGGSYLCHDSYCHRYRVAARSCEHPGVPSGNIGFRCAS